MKNHCTKCNEPYDVKKVFSEKNKFPRCEKCNSLVRPDITLYGEKLNMKNYNEASNFLKKAKTLIVAGTSLTVFPAAGLLDNFFGENLIIINEQETSRNSFADIIIRDDLKEVFEELSKIINK